MRCGSCRSQHVSESEHLLGHGIGETYPRCQPVHEGYHQIGISIHVHSFRTWQACQLHPYSSDMRNVCELAGRYTVNNLYMFREKVWARIW